MSENVERGGRPTEAERLAGGPLLADEHDQQTSPLADGLDERLVALIQEEVTRRFQSAKDRRWAQLEKQYGALSGLLAEKPAAAPEAADDEMSLQSHVYTRLLQGLTAALQQTGAEISAAASPAAVAQPGGAGAPPSDLQAAYEQRKAALRPGDVQSLTALKREFRHKGLDVF